ncbi:hypothetical protein AB0F15_29600 [Amycolatopsis sp. NPDC026612]|uniref:hypothetical protein n=1 Tax=Amycolatopsis sp. NPDC026612 TaxID=3155466 RepID=UPI003400ADAB
MNNPRRCDSVNGATDPSTTTDREMAHQESVMNLSQDSGAGLAPDDVHPDHPKWQQAYGEHLQARRVFVDSALKHIRSLAEK